MSRKCSVCGKGSTSGNTISAHRGNRNLRKFLPNLQRVRAITEHGPRRVLVCTSCLKSGNIQRAV